MSRASKIMPVDSVISWAQVVHAARREGRVTVYSAARGNPVSPRIAQLFRERHGIDVEFIEERTEVIVDRIRRELAAGSMGGDITLNGATATAVQSGERHFAAPGPLPGLARLPSTRGHLPSTVPVFLVHYGILVNTTLVPPEARPTSWRDLLQPRWQDRLLCDDFRRIGAGGVLFAALLDRLGEDFHRALAAQRPRFSLASRTLEQRIVRGEFPVFLPFTMPNLGDLHGLPVIGYVPAEGAPCVRFDAALLRGAPHPNAGRLFLDFLLSPDVQDAYAARDFGPVISTAAVHRPTPPFLPPPARSTAENLRLAGELYALTPSAPMTS